MDEIDLKLIDVLQIDGRASNTEMAKKLGISEATVSRRIHNLISSGTITITAVPEPYKIGYKTMAFIGVNVQLSEINNVAKKLAAYSQVHYVGLCSGSTDIFAWVLFRSPEELSDFVTNELAAIPGIIRTDTIIQLKLLKRTLGHLQFNNSLTGK